jgi:hypothetical protein
MNFVFAIAMLVISYAITALTAKKQPNNDAKPARIGDFSFPTHDEGTAQAVVFGECWTEDWMVLYYGNLSSEAIKAKSSGGKK